MMKKIIIALVSILLLTSCSSNATGVTNMNIEEFSGKIKEAGVIILDVRTPGEFTTGYIEGSQNIDFQSGNFQAEIESLDKNATYAIYCRSGNRSGQAAAVMHKNGFQELYNLDGGVIDWANAGMPLVNN